MSKKARDNRPYIRPVTKLELSEKNIKFRWIAIVVLLAIAAVAIGYGFYSALSTEPGWQEVTVQPKEVNCSKDFVLMYDFGVGDVNPTMQYKHLETLYGELTVSAYELFSPEVVSEKGDNLQAVNAAVNTTVRVDPALYRALELLVRYDNRHVFLAPVTALYRPVFLSEGDGEAMAFDPAHDRERAEIVMQTAAFCADSDHVRLELLGENQVKLSVSEDYLAFAEEYGIDTFLDFGWMTNAFIADYMAEILTENGHIHGYLVTYDGFTRNLDVTGGDYSINFFDREGSTITMPARLSYTGHRSVVSLRDYPLSDQDRWHYYSYESGEITTVFLDPADGVSKSATDSLMAYSDYLSCGEVLMQVAPLFTVDSLDVIALTQLTEERIYSVWAEENTLFYTQADAALTLLPDSGGQDYQLEYVK